eukprot:m.132991 g.132991  ORF g.132991 m.132991 type:complete len:288 (+) comp17518_c0_seq2:73-936(+)
MARSVTTWLVLGAVVATTMCVCSANGNVVRRGMSTSAGKRNMGMGMSKRASMSDTSSHSGTSGKMGKREGKGKSSTDSVIVTANPTLSPTLSPTPTPTPSTTLSPTASPTQPLPCNVVSAQFTSESTSSTQLTVDGTSYAITISPTGGSSAPTYVGDPLLLEINTGTSYQVTFSPALSGAILVGKYWRGLQGFGSCGSSCVNYTIDQAVRVHSIFSITFGAQTLASDGTSIRVETGLFSGGLQFTTQISSFTVTTDTTSTRAQSFGIAACSATSTTSLEDAYSSPDR